MLADAVIFLLEAFQNEYAWEREEELSITAINLFPQAVIFLRKFFYQLAKEQELRTPLRAEKIGFAFLPAGFE